MNPYSVVPRDQALLLVTEDRVEVDRRHERTGGSARRARERRIVHGQEVLGEIAICGLERGNTCRTQFVDEALLQRPIQALAPARGSSYPR